MPEPSHPYYLLKAACDRQEATLVAVSKTRSPEDILAIYQLGQRVFAENRVQELVAKAPLLPADIEWHLIGHLQTNKVRQVLPHVRLIHSLDRASLWETLDSEAGRLGRQIDCLLQVKVAQEESKFGWEFQELRQFLADRRHLELPRVRIRGLMGMATLTEDRDQVRSEFRELAGYYRTLRQGPLAGEQPFSILSMGMSSDYDIALEEGSTMIRVGSLLFAPPSG